MQSSLTFTGLFIAPRVEQIVARPCCCSRLGPAELSGKALEEFGSLRTSSMYRLIFRAMWNPLSGLSMLAGPWLAAPAQC